MKLPKAFRPEKSLDAKTEELLVPKDSKKIDIAFLDYKQIRYTTEGTSWVIEYTKHDNYRSQCLKTSQHRLNHLLEYEGHQWVLYDKEFGEQKWFESKELSKLAENILKNRINSLVELLNLKEKDYSIEKDNFKAILDRHATKVLESKESIEDKEHGKCYTFLYEKGNLMIELKEFEKINLGRVEILDDQA